MYYLGLILGCVGLLLSAMPCHASSGAGEIGANLIDPTTMDLPEAIELCEREPALVKCEIIQEKIKIEQAFDIEKMVFIDQEVTYDVFNANFE